MCLAFPGKVLEKNGFMAKVSFGGIQKEICILFCQEVKIGEYCLIHAGFAISVVDEKEAANSLLFLETV